METVYPSVDNDANTASAKIIYQCKYCFTVYDEAFGDAENNIAPGTSFNNLPQSYHCPLCESGKNNFVTTNETSLELQGA